MISKNLLQDLETQKKKYNAEGKYKEAKEIQKKLDFYYYGIIY
jgi:hypothetical protein